MGRGGRGEEEEEEVVVMEGEQGSGGSDGWERLLPRMPVRVLLVEGDDSTRQIIAALLRKCSYKVVVASDGVKAWETLKEKSCNIDLVLTEVELPLMSGFILLSMIMEHETCKNIPVIMMSSHDPVSTVFKCMLKGAADFLVKPIRKNELRNLWQHVWRRQITSGRLDVRHPHHNENHTRSGLNARQANGELVINSIARREEFSEQGSDAQSSCTRSDMEVESKHIQRTLENEPPTVKVLSDVDRRIVQPFEANFQLGSLSLMHVPESEDNRNDDLTATGQPDRDSIMADKASEVDLIGVINSKTEHNAMIVDLDAVQKNSQEYCMPSAPHLELSLKRFDFGSLDNQENNGRHKLNHSISSAFSLYNNRITAVSAVVGDAPGCTNSTPNIDLEYTKLAVPSVVAKAGNTVHCTPVRVVPFPVPTQGISFDKLATWQGPLTQSLFSPHSTPPLWSNWQDAAMQTSSSNQTDPSSLNSAQVENSLHTEGKQEDTRGPLDEQRRVSCIISESSHVNPCNADIIALSGSVSPGNTAHVSSCNKHEAVVTNIHNDSIHLLSQREVALNKFRLKRKERCFEKKVRYQSRKLLAEQRPRVKGQFVRHDRPVLQGGGEE